MKPNDTLAKIWGDEYNCFFLFIMWLGIMISELSTQAYASHAREWAC